jgi:DnaJ-class molecular chaperone
MSTDMDFYQVLGLSSKNVTEEEIKKAYKKMAIKFHPDKCKDADAKDKFQKISEAYEVLSNVEKRKMYDEYGKEGLEHMNSAGGRTGMSQEEMFARFFGGGDDDGHIFGGSFQQQKRTKDLIFRMGVTLSDLYNGVIKKLAINREIICKTCEGKCHKDNADVKPCKQCDGKGYRVKMLKIGMGMMLNQGAVECEQCMGNGKMFSREDRCDQCVGKGVQNERIIKEIGIKKGMSVGDTITLESMSHEALGMKTGDVVIILVEKADATKKFTRSGSDLYLTLDISLKEALTGFQREIIHLDDSKIFFEIKPGTVVDHATVRTLQKGMPIYGTDKVGSLIIKFSIVYPKQLSLEAIEEIKKIL